VAEHIERVQGKCSLASALTWQETYMPIFRHICVHVCMHNILYRKDTGGGSINSWGLKY
jgi:hypothetical protein